MRGETYQNYIFLLRIRYVIVVTVEVRRIVVAFNQRCIQISEARFDLLRCYYSTTRLLTTP